MSGAADFVRVEITRPYPRSGVVLQPGAVVVLPASAVPGLSAVNPPFGRVLGPAGQPTAVVLAAALAPPPEEPEAPTPEGGPDA